MEKTALPATDQEAIDADDEDSDQADVNKTTAAERPKMETTVKVWGSPRQSPDSKVQRILMPIANRTAPATKPSASLKTLMLPGAKVTQRPRRVTAAQP
jgi:hypothetical protein